MTIEYRNQKPVAAEKAQIPPWAAIAALVLCLVIGGGVVWWFLFGSTPKTKTITVDPKLTIPDPSQFRNQQRVPRFNSSGVNQIAPNQWRARGTAGGMQVAKQGNGPYTYDYFFTNNILPPDQLALASSRRRIISDEAMAQEWGVTPEQVEKLKTVELTWPIPRPGFAEAQAIQKLWLEYTNANGTAKADVEKKLTTALDDAAKKGTDAAKTRFAEQLKQLETILTPEQRTKITSR